MDALCCCQCPAAFISLLCSRATTQTNNSKHAEVIAMPSACNVATIVMNTTLADILVLRSSCTSGPCSVAAVIQGQSVAAAIWVAEGMQAMQEKQY